MKEPFLCRRKKPAVSAAVNGPSRKLKLVCSFNGAFQRRPPSGKLRYIGGETRIISVDRTIGFAKLRSKISDLCPSARSFSVKYQLPKARNGHDGGRDAPVVPIASDDDVRCMIEEHEKLELYGKHSRLWIYVCSEECVFVKEDRDLYVNCGVGAQNVVGVHQIEGEIGGKSGNRVMCGDDSLRKAVLKEQILVKQSSQNVHCVSCFKGNETEIESACYDENLKFDHPLLDLGHEPHIPISLNPNLENLFGLNISDCKITSSHLPRSDHFGNVVHYPPSNPRDGNLLVEANNSSQCLPGQSGQVLCNGDGTGAGNLGQSVRIAQQSCNASMNSRYHGPFAKQNVRNIEEGTMSIMNRENVPWTANNASVKNDQVPLSCNGQLVGIAYRFNPNTGHKLCGSLQSGLCNHRLGVNDTRNHRNKTAEINNYQAVKLDRRPFVGKCYPVIRPNSNISKHGQSGRSYHHPLKIYTGFHTPKFDGRTTVVKPSNEDIREVGVLAVPLDGNPNPEKPLLSHDAVEEASSCTGTVDALLMGFNSEVPCKTIHENFRDIPISCEPIDSDLEKECLLMNPQKVTNNSGVSNNPVDDFATKSGYGADVLDAETSSISLRNYKNATRTLNGKLESSVDLSLCNLSLSPSKKVEPAPPYLAGCDVSAAFLYFKSKSSILMDEGQLNPGPVVDKSNGPASIPSSHVADKLETDHLCGKDIQEDPSLGLSHDGKADIKECQNGLKVTGETGTFIDQSVFYTRLVARELQIIKNSDLEHVKELGSGTYGTVFHGKWKGSDVAIKRIKPSCFTEGGTEENRLIADFWREAHILGQLQHPNIVALYGVVTDGPVVNLATVTEYMVNGSLKQVLRRKDRTIDRRKRLIIAMDAAFGMEYLHEKNIVHFDLKSHNFLVNIRDPQRPVCKIGDMGLSKVKQKTLISGGLRGTIPWMAPELLNSENNLVTEKVDVYSFGIVMWELLTGEEPYGNMRSEEIIAGIIKGNLRPEIPNWCEPTWRSLMKRCWSSDPNSRPSFSEIAKELRSMSASMNINGLRRSHC